MHVLWLTTVFDRNLQYKIHVDGHEVGLRKCIMNDVLHNFNDNAGKASWKKCVSSLNKVISPARMSECLISRFIMSDDPNDQCPVQFQPLEP